MQHAGEPLSQGRRVQLLGQIALVHQHQQAGRLLCRRHGLFVLVCQSLGAVQHQQGQRRPLRRLTAAFHTHSLDAVSAVSDTGGIRQPQQYAAHQHLFLHGVAGGTGDVGDDGAVVA